MKVKDLMSASVVCARPETSVKQLARLMKQENIGAIPICTDLNEILGIVTDRDIVLRNNAASDTEPKAAENIMTKHVVYVSPNMDTHEAALLLSKYQVRRLPVVNNGKLVGMFALADVARKTLYIDEAGDALNAISKINSLT